jgi:hypothetical protein
MARLASPRQRRRAAGEEPVVIDPAVGRGADAHACGGPRPIDDAGCGADERIGDDEHTRAAVGQQRAVLGRREPPRQRREQRAQTRAGEEQADLLGAVVTEVGNAVAATDAAGGQCGRRLPDLARETRVAVLAPRAGQRDLFRRERRVPIDPVGQIHGLLHRRVRTRRVVDSGVPPLRRRRRPPSYFLSPTSSTSAIAESPPHIRRAGRGLRRAGPLLDQADPRRVPIGACGCPQTSEHP